MRLERMHEKIGFFLSIVMTLLSSTPSLHSQDRSKWMKITEDYERYTSLSKSFVNEGEYDLAILLWTRFIDKIERLEYVPENIQKLRIQALEKLEEIKRLKEKAQVKKGGEISSIFELLQINGDDLNLEKVERVWHRYIESPNGRAKFSNLKTIYLDIYVQPSADWDRESYFYEKSSEMLDRFGFKRAFKDSSIYGLTDAGILVKGSLKGRTTLDTMGTFPLYISNWKLSIEHILFRNSGKKVRVIELNTSGKEYSIEEAEKMGIDHAVRALFEQILLEVVREFVPSCE